jgi:hypothetical protein
VTKLPWAFGSSGLRALRSEVNELKKAVKGQTKEIKRLLEPLGK